VGGYGLGLAKPKTKPNKVLRFGLGKITTRYIIGWVRADPLIFGLDWIMGYPTYFSIF